MKNPEKLIGKKVYGFKFESKEIYFRNIMNIYIGKVGVITKLFKEKISFEVTFEDGYAFAYPADQIEAHLVEDEIPTLSDGVMMLVGNNHITYEEEKVFFKHNGKYYAKIGLSFEPYNYCKPLEPTKEEQLIAILGSSDKVNEIMELFNDKKE